VDIIAKLKENENREINALLQNLRLHEKPLIFFGVGFIGKKVYDVFDSLGIKPDFFCDNDDKKVGTYFLDVPIISFKTLCDNYYDSNVLITTRKYSKEIREQLNSNGIYDIEDFTSYDSNNFYGLKNTYYPLLLTRETYVRKVYNLLSDELSKKIFYNVINCRDGKINELSNLKSKSSQYFEKDLIHLSAQEVFIDGGAFIGDTVEEFLKYANGKFKRVYSFEPDEENYSELVKNIRDNKDIIPMPYGLWNEKDNLKFQKGLSPSSNRISDSNSGSLDIPVISIDEAIKEDIPTFIKLDVEGSELKALEGAKNTIVEHKPKLAICVYHKPFDIIDIPIYIKKLVPEYKLYLRHYSDTHLETVLYAII